MNAGISESASSPSSVQFSATALELFRFQYRQNPIYQAYANAMGKDPSRVSRIEEIPFLPIRFFKTQRIQTTAFEPELIFESSGTTGTVSSQHLVKDAGLYRHSLLRGFQHFYGNPSAYCLLGLLPPNREKAKSSLAYMVDELARQSGHPESGFYLDDPDRLALTLRKLDSEGQRVLLIGVSFALLDFVSRQRLQLRQTIVMETGGMKGRGKELTRAELHDLLREGFGVPVVHSEYGMTELLSQAYASAHGKFLPVPWMLTLSGSEDDPAEVRRTGEGLLHFIDLANTYSCAFIASEDIGTVYPDGSFEVWGRLDRSDLRGCSLLVP
jgi:hypothetical protein